MHQLGTVADHAAPLEVAARLEARRVDERDDRDVEVVAPRDETRRLARCLDVERARALLRLVGDDADRSAVEACRARSRGSARAARAARANDVVVDDVGDHVAHVVGGGRRGRESRPRRSRSVDRAGRRSRSGAGRRGDGRGDTRGCRPARRGRRARRRRRASRRRSAARAPRAEPSSARVTWTPVNSVTARAR